MMLSLCILIVIACIVYLVRLSRKAASPAFAVRGVLTGEKLGYMLSALAYGAKRTDKGNGIGMREIRRRLFAARRAVGKRLAEGKTLEACEQTFFDAFYKIDEAMASVTAAKKTLRRLPHTKGRPRIYDLCELLVKSCGGVLHRNAVLSAVRGYCAETPLTFHETEALGNMLRLCLCEYLAMYAQKIESMATLIGKGERDAREGKADPAFVRYNSYIYGFMQSDDVRWNGPSGAVDAYRKRESFLAGAAQYNARVGAAVQSLHALDAFMTDAFVCSLSPVYEQLREGDPTFCALSVATQNMYLRQIATTARRRRAPEKSVAQEILFRAARDGKDVSFYILPPMASSAVLGFLIAGTLIGTVAIGVAWAIFLPAVRWLYFIFALPVFAYAVDFVWHRVGKRLVKRRYLPAYAPETLSPKKDATVLFVPCYAADTGDIESAFVRLQTVAAANAEPVFSYCILFDYPKSDTPVAEGDAALDGAIRAEYEKLGDLRARVCVLVRSRARIRDGQDWQGYEKKRGAVLDFNRYVLTGKGDFSLALGALPRAKYAVTLDADTALYNAISLVCTKAHPYCADVALVSLRCKAREKRTPFSKLYGGETGPGRYREQSYNAGNDLFGVGNFTGKGIYDIAMFNKRLEGLFPDNRILSHDYIEGAAAGCLDSSVCAAEDVPQTFAESFTRDLRWLRGDWQLLPYMLPRIKNKAGEKTASPLPHAARYAIATNLLLSLVPIAQVFVLLLSLFTGAPAAVWALAFLPQLLRAVFSLASLPFCARQTAYEFLRCCIDLALLPTMAAYKLCAVVVTLYRLCVRKKLLEWRVFAHAGGRISLLPNAVAAIVFTATAAVFSLSPWYYGLSVLFLAGIAASMLLSRARRTAQPSDVLLSRLHETAKQTFSYFAAQEEKYALPCDCYQEDNRMGWCERTSPTNIGMALIAYAAAYELGLIDKARLLSYATRIVTAVEKCEKWRGHLYNWYDCHTLAVLPARFVSTVDSGNFTAALSLLSTYTDGALRDRINALIDATDFMPLYDGERKLLYIGYDDEKKTCTENHYDLLGSESTLTYLLACGYGKIPKEAFFGLDRHGVRYGNAITVYSWTGGMFEYLMSRLLFAPPSDTLYAQAMQGAVKAHIRYGKKEGSGVWGVSECRYAALDESGGNLYRAFGVPQIAHSVPPARPPFAPYAAFLALPYCGEKTFVRTADAYALQGAAGEYGFCESLKDGAAVRSYMTHHQGMTLAACANAVKNDVLPRRLLSLPQWRAAQLMCGEGRIQKAKRKKSFPVSVRRPLSDEGVYIGKSARLCAVASARDMYLQYGNKRLLHNVHIVATDGKQRQTELLHGAFAAHDSAVWHRRKKNFQSVCELNVLPAPLSAAFTVTYRNTTSTRARVDFTVHADPVLMRIEDYQSHPAYARLFMRTDVDGQLRSLSARRKGEGIALLLTVTGQDNVEYIGDKCTLFARGRQTDASESGNPVLAGRWHAEIETGKTVTFTCVFAVAESTEQADYAVRLAAADCVARNKGAAISLARTVSPFARKTALQLLQWRWGACRGGFVPLDKQAAAFEVTAQTLPRLHRLLADLRLLYEAGLDFHTVLFCRKYKGEYPALYFDIEHAVQISGIRGAAGGCSVTAVQCDAQAYRMLKQHTPRNDTSRRIRIVNGKTEPYTPEKSNGKRVVYTAVAREKDNAALATLLPSVAAPQGVGGFAADGAYVLPHADTPAPWCNILSNGEAGTVMSESGGGYTFGENARQYKLTDWSNDPVGDEVSELIAVGYGGEWGSVTRRPLGNGAYGTVHALGCTRFLRVYRGIQTELNEYIDRLQSRKIYEVTVRNTSAASVGLCVLCAVKAVLGDFRRNTLPSLTAKPIENGLHMRCENSGCEAFLCCDSHAFAVGADIEEGELALYDGLAPVRQFWGVAAPVHLAAGESIALRFALSTEAFDGFSEEKDAALQSRLFYEKLPRITFDGEYGYLTKWLPYQVYNSRFAGRTGFYQVSGAYGFRDQLQDCLALLYCDPTLVREHILECARHQFKEGDVQHWWHPPAVGVRTHVCDDRLWLVYIACAYAAHTGDTAVFDESVPFLCDVPIAPQDASVYTSAQTSSARAALREHCLRAIEVSCDFGEHGLVRMRGGDWNDAMDKVGEKGVGESVWCTMFLHKVIGMFLPYAKDAEVSENLRAVANDLYAAVCAAFGDGRFYRAYCDDGSVLGAPHSSACKIDLLTQSWSVLSGIGSAAQKEKALQSAYELLCDGDHRIVKLFDPPFTSPDGVGYIGNYPQGVRENGGQYTQAAVWYVYALFCMGQTERANELLRWLSPAHRTRTEKDAVAYSVEPYVSAADVYSGDLAGKGGWTWYTGSAAWLYACLIEQYAGITVRGDVLRFCPHLPAGTKELNVTVLWEGKEICIKIVNGKGEGEWRVRIGEVVYNTSSLRLTKGLEGKKIAVIRLP